MTHETRPQIPRLNWYAQQRQEWIDEMLHIYGFINRKHIMAKFQCSEALAAGDLRTFSAATPDRMTYCPQRKAYLENLPR